MKGAATWIALALSLVGGLVAAGAYYRVRSAPALPGDPAAVDALKVRIAHLEAEISRLNQGKGPPLPPAPSGSPLSSDQELADLRKRVEALERRPPLGSGTPGFTDQSRPSRGNQVAIESQKKRLMDTTITDQQRAAALGTLRLYAAHKADDVVDAALALLASAQEARIRAVILRNLRGSDNAKVPPVLIRSLSSDPDEDVRTEAAQTLGEYLGQAEVKSALQQAAANDPSDKVRHRAETALATPAKK
ncbi:MAG TPA: HEAT repeat domain-containing protein [Planctomycetota bacterium]|nr:HEAT repeat domain-containing protein [Planctomycetota bacterium]